MSKISALGACSGEVTAFLDELPGKLFLIPVEKLTECRAAMAVMRLFLGAQFRKGLVDARKVEQRIVSKAVAPAWCVQNDPFGRAPKYSQGFAIARRCQYADEASGAFLRRNLRQFAEYTGVIGLIVSVGVGQMRFVSSVARGVHSRGPMQGIDFQSGIVGDHNFFGSGQAVFLGFLPGVLFEGLAVFYGRGQRCE